MSAQNNGGPAFPNVPDGAGDKWSDWDKGMTLRDYFAAKAMQAYLTDPNVGFDRDSIEIAAQTSFRIADAMLEARQK